MAQYATKLITKIDQLSAHTLLICSFWAVSFEHLEKALRLKAFRHILHSELRRCSKWVFSKYAIHYYYYYEKFQNRILRVIMFLYPITSARICNIIQSVKLKGIIVMYVSKFRPTVRTLHWSLAVHCDDKSIAQLHQRNATKRKCRLLPLFLNFA